jgi:hypothetical protein
MIVHLSLLEIFTRHPEYFPITTYFLATFGDEDLDVVDEWFRNLDEEIFDALVINYDKFVKNSQKIHEFDDLDFLQFVQELAVVIHGKKAGNDRLILGATVSMIGKQLEKRTGSGVAELFDKSEQDVGST